MPWLLCDPVKVAIPGHAKSAQEPSIETSRCPKFFEMAFTSSMSMILFLGSPPDVEEEEKMRMRMFCSTQTDGFKTFQNHDKIRYGFYCFCSSVYSIAKHHHLIWATHGTKSWLLKAVVKQVAPRWPRNPALAQCGTKHLN